MINTKSKPDEIRDEIETLSGRIATKEDAESLFKLYQKRNRYRQVLATVLRYAYEKQGFVTGARLSCRSKNGRFSTTALKLIAMYFDNDTNDMGVVTHPMATVTDIKDFRVKSKTKPKTKTK